jgi:hypothetical protein
MSRRKEKAFRLGLPKRETVASMRKTGNNAQFRMKNLTGRFHLNTKT